MPNPKAFFPVEDKMKQTERRISLCRPLIEGGDKTPGRDKVSLFLTFYRVAVESREAKKENAYFLKEKQLRKTSKFLKQVVQRRRIQENARRRRGQKEEREVLFAGMFS